MPSRDEWRAAYGTPEYRVYRTARRYGMTVEQFDEMLTKQNGQCFICKAYIDRRSARVDHDPECCDSSAKTVTCGKCVRSLLCHPCNIAVGHIENAIYDGHFHTIVEYVSNKHREADTNSDL